MPALDSPPSGEHPSLAESIATATRPVHAKLNRLIVGRLPLALPPRASDPSLYLSGLLHIAPIYLTFEASWQRILTATPPSGLSGAPPAACNVGCHPSTCRPALVDLLGQLQIPDLFRSDRLRADIRKLTGWSDRLVDEELHQLVRSPGYLADFVDHIERAVDDTPHVLIAYSYIMYMALFAGGRFIRASLEYASDLFWAQTPSSLQPHLHPDGEDSTGGGLFNNLDRRLTEDDDDSDASSDALLSAQQSSHAAHTMPLQFLHFSGPLDGEDLKRDYKQTLANVEAVLTSQEKKEIVQEAVRIFEHIINIVHQLDTVCQRLKQPESESESETESTLRPWTAMVKNPLGYRFRDSVVVTKERKARRTVS